MTERQKGTWFRFRLQTLFGFMLGVAVGYGICLQSLRWATPSAENLDAYRIEPPDLLRIETPTSQRLSGTFMVQPDGRITLAGLGSVPASGKTLDELSNLIHQRLGPGRSAPSSKVRVSLVASNSKVCYLITQNRAAPDSVSRLAWRSGQTAADVLARIPMTTNTSLWIARPDAKNASGVRKIALASRTSTVPVLPGDRIYVDSGNRTTSP